MSSKRIRNNKTLNELPRDVWSVITKFFKKVSTFWSIFLLSKDIHEDLMSKNLTLFPNVEFKLCVNSEIISTMLKDQNSMYGFASRVCIVFHRIQKSEIENEMMSKLLHQKFPRIRALKISKPHKSSFVEHLLDSLQNLREVVLDGYSFSKIVKPIHGLSKISSLLSLKIFESNGFFLEDNSSLESLEIVNSNPLCLLKKDELRFKNLKTFIFRYWDLKHENLEQAIQSFKNFFFLNSSITKVEIAFRAKGSSDLFLDECLSFDESSSKLDELNVFGRTKVLNGSFFNYLPPSLTRLDISYSCVDPKNMKLERIKEVLKNLEYVDISSCEKINDSFLSALSGSKKLKVLKMRYCTQESITPVGFSLFKACLEYIDMKGCNQKSFGFKFLFDLFTNNEKLQCIKVNRSGPSDNHCLRGYPFIERSMIFGKKEERPRRVFVVGIEDCDQEYVRTWLWDIPKYRERMNEMFIFCKNCEENVLANKCGHCNEDTCTLESCGKVCDFPSCCGVLYCIECWENEHCT